ncbi:FAD-dependent pyridine nucleotide-disulfide oxidoreductase [Microthyrium microscopicum]|uniref:FAD-dependent pyridine nucleotide-disulfide oxidoreductase n=1 Tax=Microthyrium microscopicum TaxID=703497 RepID=A0A6A6UKQ0_9PEZI|nr:FAD-dependent pyridine nucleotide-disulfide oxidoreductase [Microthyrium microscopicum]
MSTAPPASYDAIIIGSGQSGNPLASALTAAGHSTALIEATHIGGCCINDGCTPTKTLVASARVAYLARRAASYGITVPTVGVDMPAVRQRKRDIVSSWRSGSEGRLEKAGVKVVMGKARFTGEREIVVDLVGGGEERMVGKKVFVNVGERPVVPDLVGLSEVMEKSPDRVLDSTSVQELGVVPGKLLVLGGGYIGLEFGQLFRRLGAEVTVVQRADRLAVREDEDIAECLKGILEEDGIEVLVGSQATEIKMAGGEKLELTVKSKDGLEKKLEGTHVLLATGRRPNTDTLDLDKTSVKVNKRGYIEFNDDLTTSVEGIYVLGDVKGPPAFTHVSYDDFRILRDSLGLNPDGKIVTRTVKSRDGLVPYCMYTDPQLGHVGLHLHEVPAGTKVKVAKMPMSYVARALETDEPRGMMKAVVDAETGKIVGFTCLGIEGGELVSVVQLAMMGGLHYQQLADAVFAHPAIAECLNNLWGYLEDV